jgi:signal transduction histidine kinase
VLAPIEVSDMQLADLRQRLINLSRDDTLRLSKVQLYSISYVYVSRRLMAEAKYNRLCKFSKQHIKNSNMLVIF